MPLQLTRRVAFSETDASGRVHFTQILKWAEDAEHQALAKAGVPVVTATSGWPRVKVSCDYRRALAFGDEVSVSVSLLAVGNSSLTWSFTVTNAQEEVAAEGSLVTVFTSDEGKSVIPDSVRTELHLISEAK